MAGLRLRDINAKFRPVDMKSTRRVKLPYLGLLDWVYLLRLAKYYDFEARAACCAPTG